MKLNIKLSITIRFLCIYCLSIVIILVVSSIQIYHIQENDYKKNVEDKSNQISAYLEGLIKMEHVEFLCMQEYVVKNIEKIIIPRNFDGNYNAEKIKFERKFAESYPNKIFNEDVQFKEMSDELQLLYAEYAFRKWLTIFEKAAKNFGVKYTYYLVPSSEHLHMYWLLDFHRGVSKYYGSDYINICADVFEPLEEHEKMWEAWNTGRKPKGCDVYDNKYGKTYAYYSPLIIDEKNTV